MRSWWFTFLCLSVAACADSKSGTSVDAVTAADAGDSMDQGASGAGGTSAGSGGRATGGAGGEKSKAASGSGKKKSSSTPADKSSKKKDEKKGDKQASAPDNKAKKSSKGSDGSSSNNNSGDVSDGSKTDTTQVSEKPAPKSIPMTGDQLSVCTRTEGDCNKGLACQAPATRFSTGRGFCSKICETDDDCSGLPPEGTSYACSTGTGVRTCEIACSGTDDSSCPSGLSCVQVGIRRGVVRAPALGMDAGVGDAGSDASVAIGFGPQGVFRCRYPAAVSKTWESCGDASHVCDKDLVCTGFWLGGVGYCTHSCDSDADCETPASGNAKPTCVTLAPAFGQRQAVKQCALSCSDAKDGCPSDLVCVQGRQPPRPVDGGVASAPAWCQ